MRVLNRNRAKKRIRVLRLYQRILGSGLREVDRPVREVAEAREKYMRRRCTEGFSFQRKGENYDDHVLWLAALEHGLGRLHR